MLAQRNTPLTSYTNPFDPMSFRLASPLCYTKMCFATQRCVNSYSKFRIVICSMLVCPLPQRFSSPSNCLPRQTKILYKISPKPLDKSPFLLTLHIGSSLSYLFDVPNNGWAAQQEKSRACKLLSRKDIRKTLKERRKHPSLTHCTATSKPSEPSDGTSRDETQA